jgi:hypothetical protein
MIKNQTKALSKAGFNQILISVFAKTNYGEDLIKDYYFGCLRRNGIMPKGISIILSFLDINGQTDLPENKQVEFIKNNVRYSYWNTPESEFYKKLSKPVFYKLIVLCFSHGTYEERRALAFSPQENDVALKRDIINYFFKLLEENKTAASKFMDIVRFMSINGQTDLPESEQIEFIKNNVRYSYWGEPDSQTPSKNRQRFFDKISNVGGLLVPDKKELAIDSSEAKTNCCSKKRSNRKHKSVADIANTIDYLQRVIYRIIYSERCKYRKALNRDFDNVKTRIEPITQELYNSWIQDFIRINAENGIIFPNEILSGIHYPKINRRWAN